MVDGRRVWFQLATGVKREAAVKAAQIWVCCQAEGLAVALERWKRQPAVNSAASVVGVTVGDVLQAASAFASARESSLRAYSTALRAIVAEVVGITEQDREARRAAADRVVLDAITPAAVTAWKVRRLSAARDPVAKRAAVVTVNSLIRNARALFSRRLLPFLRERLSWDGPVPFDGVLLEKAPSVRYQSRLDAPALLRSAWEELERVDPDVLTVIVLALACGLRRSEIDWLCWPALDLDAGKLRVESTKWHQLKSEDSAGVLDLSGDVAAWLRERQKAASPGAVFVLRGRRVGSFKTGYRCKPLFSRVVAWLRGKGVVGKRPMHTLRKEIGSLIAAEHGIFAASRYLRHADIKITAAVYADQKNAVTSGLLAGLRPGGNAR